MQIVTKKVGQVFEADIRSYFTRINHQWLRKMVAHRIADPVILGLIEGATEFIPVSSTGHLLLAKEMMGLGPSWDTFVVLIQLGAILSVVVIYASLANDVWFMRRGSKTSIFIAVEKGFPVTRSITAPRTLYA